VWYLLQPAYFCKPKKTSASDFNTVFSKHLPLFVFWFKLKKHFDLLTYFLWKNIQKNY